ncbi:hypothetical protein C8R44DRAFT_622356, partial [Mycena epipterygia]
LSKKCQYQIFTFLTECIKPKSTWTLLKPHVQTLVESFVFPQLSFAARRQNLWESDPVDYVRISVGEWLILFTPYRLLCSTPDEYEIFATPVSAATTFLFSLASNRTKTTFMPILGFINSVLRSLVSFTSSVRTLVLIMVACTGTRPRRSALAPSA